MRTKRKHKKRFKYRLGYSKMLRCIKMPITLEDATELLVYAFSVHDCNDKGIVKCILKR